MADSTLRKTLRNVLTKAPRNLLGNYRQNDTLSELLREVLEGSSRSHQIATVKVAVAEEALGLDFRKAIQSLHPWYPMEEMNIGPVHVSQTYTEMIERLEKSYDLSSEGFTRTFIDMVVLEAMEHTTRELQLSTPAANCLPMNFYGEVSITSTRNKITLSGYGDYVLAHGEAVQAKISPTLPSLGVKTVTSLTTQSIVQTLTYMGIVHRERQKANKSSAQVLGYVTNFKVWIFLRIKDDSSVDVSNWLAFAGAPAALQGSVIGLLARLFLEARLQSPTTTPASSATALLPTTDIQSTLTEFEHEPDAETETESKPEQGDAPGPFAAGSS
ncbi:hypothetical protein DFJ77DRAFT_512264 [Powellomyces hirtus]|nr:hypothetical protein DFJ77DRAFT_512264 [Powellomyces hirtus]